MFRVSYINNSTDKICHKGGFDSDKDAYDWVYNQGENITALKLLIWSEARKCYRAIEEF